MSAAVEQLSGALYVLASLAGLRMGCAGRKVLQMAADLGERAGLGAKRAPLDCISAVSSGYEPDSNSLANAAQPNWSRFDQGGRGSDLLRAGDGADGFGRGENFHIALALPG